MFRECCLIIKVFYLILYWNNSVQTFKCFPCFYIASIVLIITGSGLRLLQNVFVNNPSRLYFCFVWSVVALMQVGWSLFVWFIVMMNFRECAPLAWGLLRRAHFTRGITNQGWFSFVYSHSVNFSDQTVCVYCNQTESSGTKLLAHL